jgi:hypothetical protein
MQRLPKQPEVLCLSKIQSSKTPFTRNTCKGYLKQHRQVNSQLDAKLGVATLW